MDNVGQPRREYEDRIVAFIDILGWKEMICASERNQEKQNTVWAAMDLMRTPVSLWDYVKDKADALPRVVASQFSDTVVLSDEDSIDGALYLTKATQDLCWSLLLKGYLTRGAIVRGKLFHDGRSVLGPALVEAYLLEQSVARYPRIVLAPNVASGLRYKYRHYDGSIHAATLVREDFDGVSHLHILDAMWVRHFPGHQGVWTAQVRRAQDMVKGILTKLRRRSGGAQKLGTMAKYQWMLRYLRELSELLVAESRTRKPRSKNGATASNKPLKRS